ncbi:MAG: glycosyltransferase [Rhodovarius sp.]|nr:glycosyltransferase [Rhodovarius sp.]
MKPAVVVSWHVAPGLDAMPGQDRMLLFWADPLLHALAEAGHRPLLLLPLSAAPPLPPEATALGRRLARRGIALAFAVGASEEERAEAIAEALERLDPAVIHAPERLGLMLVHLSRRAAGLARSDAPVVLHARGPLLFQREEQARFLSDPAEFMAEEREIQSLALADAVITACPAVAAWMAAHPAMPEPRLVAPLGWPAAPLPPAPPRELLFPFPLASEAGLEFAIAALARARPRLPITFLGEPGGLTLGHAAQALATLPAELAWQIAPAQDLPGIARRLLRPGAIALCTAPRAAPPELLALCAAAGVPVLATDSPPVRAAAARWPGVVHILPRQERGFAAALRALPSLPAAPAPQAPAPALAPPPLLPPARRPAQTAPDPASVSLLAGGDPAAALATCRTRFALLTGQAERLADGALPALLRFQAATGAAAVTAWDSATRPLGGDAALALLCPGRSAGHLLLLDLVALRRAAPACLALAGSPQFLPKLLAAIGRLPVLCAVLAEAAAAPPAPALPGAELLPPRLAGVRTLALQALQPRQAHPMAHADRSSLHYLKLLARECDGRGLRSAALDAWRALLAAAPDDAESRDRAIALALLVEGEAPDPALVERLGPGLLPSLPAALAEHVEALLRRGDTARAGELLRRLGPPLGWPGVLDAPLAAWLEASA